jgi:hypothetical protein
MEILALSVKVSLLSVVITLPVPLALPRYSPASISSVRAWSTR